MKRISTGLLILVTSVLSFTITAHAADNNWQIADVPIASPWSENVNPDNVLPEYPRPMMKRDSWINLNGLWQFEATEKASRLPVTRKLAQKILVPFAWESALSGIRKPIESGYAWYKRDFIVPQNWQKNRTLVHFGAVDWQADVYVNGQFVMTHKGGYDPFYADISDYLTQSKKQQIIVKVYDPGSTEGIAIGKQNNVRFYEPQRYNYTASSGIWQTVWLENVPDIHITDFHAVPNIDAGTLSVKVNLNTHDGDKYKVKVVARSKGKSVAENTGNVIGYPTILNIENAKLWWPQDPFLYDLSIHLLNENNQVVDTVEGYFGMRKISLGDYYRNNYGPVKRMMLNNKFVFQMGPLDQGYWPDGLYTAPTDEALKWELEEMKAWGFNMVRKHIKVEPQRWFYWADKLGILVWQDMPNTFKKMTEDEKIQFEVELQRMIKTHWNHPSVINWTVFNEHWGAYDVVRLTESVMKLDPSRLITGNSGIDASEPDIDYEVGHLKDNHHYRAPTNPYATNTRAVVNGEYGAIGYKVKNHIWDIDGPWVHDSYEKTNFSDSIEAATAEYEKFSNMLIKFKNKDELSAAVYTQWTDVENEMNGLYSYDRKVEKLDKARVKAANEALWKNDSPVVERFAVPSADSGPESISP